MAELSTTPDRLLLAVARYRERENSAKRHSICAVKLRLNGRITMPQVYKSSAYHRVSCELKQDCGKNVTPSKAGEAMSQIRRHKFSHMHNVAAFSTTKDPSLQWFAAYTTPRHEKHVSEVLAERDIETFLPLYRTVRQWKKSVPVMLELPLFPCYVFVRIARSARGAVLGLPGVLSIVGSSKEPWPLPHSEIEALRFGALMGKAEPHPYLKIGQRVRLKTGAMAGLEGILVRKKNDFRFVLTLEAIMRSVAVEVDANDLELVDQAAPAINFAGGVLKEVSSN